MSIRSVELWDKAFKYNICICKMMFEYLQANVNNRLDWEKKASLVI